MVLILKLSLSFSFCCRSCFSLFNNISRKVVSMPFNFIKGIHLAVDTLCEAEVLSSSTLFQSSHDKY